jgi:histone H3/H4
MHLNESKPKKSLKRELPNKYKNATIGAQNFYRFGFTSPGLRKCFKRGGGYSITTKGVDAIAERTYLVARQIILDAVRIAQHCGKKTIDTDHVKFAVDTARARLNLRPSPMLGFKK